MDDDKVADLIRDFEILGRLLSYHEYVWRSANSDSNRQAAEDDLRRFLPEHDSWQRHDQLTDWAQDLATEAHRRGVDPGPIAAVVAKWQKFDSEEAVAAIANLRARLGVEADNVATATAVIPPNIISYQPNKPEQRIIEMIRVVGHRLTADEAVEEMETRGVKSGVRGMLAVLNRAQLLDNKTDSNGSGYGLPEWSTVQTKVRTD